MSNFAFLHTNFPDLSQKMQRAEQRVNTEAVSSASYGRLALEESIHKIYELEALDLPFNSALVNLIQDLIDEGIIPNNFGRDLTIVRKTGNNASHYGNRVCSRDALMSLKYLFGYFKWFASVYAENTDEIPTYFNESFVPRIGEEQRKIKEQQQEAQRLQQQLEEKLKLLREEREKWAEKAEESEAALEAFKQQIAKERKQAEQNRIAKQQIISSEFSEAETRTHLIDVALNEAGWFNMQQGRELEYPVKGMLTADGRNNAKGRADYVLWANNGKPLAVIEAKRTTTDAESGKYQAAMYADALEQMHGQRPVIFYTNGYETYIWDDAFYSQARRVYGFYTKDELELLISRRKKRTDVRRVIVDRAIADRPYQIEAIKRVAESFVITGVNNRLKGAKRQALLVMATGSGKTRTVAALVKAFYEFGWLKRVLFLADRKALVSQAKVSFNEYLPDYTALNLIDEEPSGTERIVFSTYQTMMNKIDQFKPDDNRFYGVGHFDMIVIDEAHRSIYNRYKSIFEYFDALLVGLTATPKKAIDHNTYELFGCSTDDPTYFYALEDAVPKYLVPFKNIDIQTNFIREGIKYGELSVEEKLLYEGTFADKETGEFPIQIQAGAMNKWLFNKDTVNKVLDVLMQNGQKIEGGDKIGRTIIFAANQKHAKFIVDCFEERYPEYSAGFIAMIHNKVAKAEELINQFKDQHAENLPQIAVSVDMMDTGIDAPRVLNLVFFKVVRSYAKFWQMIGRGTRLCPNVFAPGQDKEFFKIFDVCQNFDFFSENTQNDDTLNVKTLSQQIFEMRLEVAQLLKKTAENENHELAAQLYDILHLKVESLNRDRFQVQMNLRYVEQFAERNKWDSLTEEDLHLIEEHLSALPQPEQSHENIRRFDLLMLNLLKVSLLNEPKQQYYYEKLQEIAERLREKYTIVEIKRQQALIERMRDMDFYVNIQPKQLEKIRQNIRKLMVYLENKAQQVFYTNLKDSVAGIEEVEYDLKMESAIPYRKRVEQFVRQNKHHITISKIQQNKPITTDELNELERILFSENIGTKQEYMQAYGEQPLGHFIRSILGLDETAAQEAFAEFLQQGTLTADQQSFINTIISFLTQNGIIDKKMLFEPPFTNTHEQGLFSVFDDASVGKIISIVDEINNNAGVG